MYNYYASKTGLNSHVKSLAGLPYRGQARRSWCMSEEEFWKHQAEAFRPMYELARTQVSYYRNRPGDYPPLQWEGRSILDVLSDLPVLPKETAKKFNEELWKDSLPLLTKFHTTSGTSGTPLHFPASLWDLSFLHTVRSGYFRRLTGKRHPRTLYLMGTITHEKAGNELFLRDPFSKDVHLCIYKLSRSQKEEIIGFLSKMQPELIWGYPSAMREVATLVGDRLPKMRKHSVAFSTAEPLYPERRKAIEASLCKKVYNFYSSQETCHAVMECSEGGMHINPLIGIVEILDDQNQPVEKGDLGRVVVTGLIRQAMPLLRYELGDVAVSTGYAADCPCGLEWPTIGRVEGRKEDLAKTRDGRRIGMVGTRVLEHFSGFEEGQIVQTGFEEFTCRLVTGGEKSPARDRETREQAIQKRLANHLGTNVEVKFEYPHRIERGARGKFKVFEVNF